MARTISSHATALAFFIIVAIVGSAHAGDRPIATDAPAKNDAATKSDEERAPKPTSPPTATATAAPRPKTLTAIEVYPTTIALAGARDQQSVVVRGWNDDGTSTDLSTTAELTITDATLAHLQGTTLSPLADGSTTLSVRVGEFESTIPVKIERATTRRPISFLDDVMPVFTRAGCNTGSCHGSSRGQDRFRLSLFGFDPNGDYERITREFPGRRLDLSIPERSLLVEKALGRVPHTGGHRFDPDSELCARLIEWIAAGAPQDPAPTKERPPVTPIAMELLPPSFVLEAGAPQSLTVRVRYSDGSDRDVTSLARFSSTDPEVAKVDDSGQVRTGRRGEAFIMARFDTLTTGVDCVVVPPDLEFAFPKDIVANNYIDALVDAKLAKLRMTPSPVATDAVFLRRVTLDITGTLPSPEDLANFVADESPDKRARAIDALLERKEFVEIWVMKFAELLQIRSTREVSYKSTLLYFNWLEEQIAGGVPMNQIVRKLLSSSGGTFTTPETNYYQIERDTLKVAENLAQVFMGMRIQCAQCHNHPFDRWTQDDYYGFAAFFSQIGRKKAQDPRETIVFNRGRGEVKHPVGGRVMAPKFLGGARPDLKGRDRREAVAEWLTSPDNPYFSRNLANLIWSHFFGRGIIEPVDDARISNPPSNPQLLAALTERLKAYQFDFKRLVRDICNSRTYQLSTQRNDSNRLDKSNFAAQTVRRIRAEVLLDCITQVTGTRNKFRGLPLGARAVQIADGQTSNYFLTTFGRASRETVCSCEVKMEPNLSQALHLLNGATVHRKILDGTRLKSLVQAKERSLRDRLDELYVRCYGRHLADSDWLRLTAVFGEPKPEEYAEILEDVFWALLNSKEFLFKH